MGILCNCYRCNCIYNNIYLLLCSRFCQVMVWLFSLWPWPLSAFSHTDFWWSLENRSQTYVTFKPLYHYKGRITFELHTDRQRPVHLTRTLIQKRAQSKLTDHRSVLDPVFIQQLADFLR